MRILSNFDTGLEYKLRQEYTEMFGGDHVITIHKSRLYYYRYIGTPLFGYLILLCVGFYFFYTYEPLPVWVQIAFWAIYTLLFLLVVRKVSRRYVDYKMDFLIVTPHEVIKYDQSGVFSRNIEKLHANKLKSISIQKSWLLNSLLDIWSIVFMSEWDNEQGDIEMDYIDAVEAKEKKIVHVLGLDSAP